LGYRKSALCSGATAALVVLASEALPHAQAQTTNLVRNTGCESSTSDWDSYQGSLSRTTSAPRSGTAACQVTYTGGGDYTLDDNPATVSSPPQGARYTASAWVRSTTAVGKPVQLVLRQQGGAAAPSQARSPSVALSTSWQRLEVSATVDGAGRQALEVYVAQTDAVAGNSFQVDDVSLAQVSGSTPTPTATPAPRTATPTPTSTPTPTAAPGQSADALNAQTYGGRLFASASPWNAVATGGADLLSGTMIGNLRAALAAHRFDVNTGDYGVPLYYADAATPRRTVRASTDWWGGMTAPIPPQARPDGGGDRHLAVWDVPNGKLYEFWDMVKATDGSWSAGYGVTFDAQGPGHQTGLWQNSARAYGGSLVAGAIRYQEMKDGRIPHALAMGYPTTRGDKYALGPGPDGVMAIATHNDNARSPDRTGPTNIPLGARLRLKASVDVGARCGSNRACAVIGAALKQHGAYVVDTAGVPVFYAENLQGKAVSWDGLLAPTDARPFEADDLEVLALPPLTPAP